MENNENDVPLEALEELDGEETNGDSAQRARNRTVMLTPDITGEVRARLAQDISGGGATEEQDAAEAPAFGAADQAPRDEPAFGGGFGDQRPAESGFGQFGGAESRPAESGYAQFGSGQPAESPSSSYGQVISSPPAQPSFTQPAGGVTQEQAAPSHVTGDRIVWVKKGPVIGFLVSFDRDENGEVFPLRTGRLIVTSEAASAGNFLIVQDDSVSPMHAILRMTKSGEIQVLDQLSEHGTQIKRFGSDELEELSGDKGTLEHGDVIYFGERKFCVCVLVRDEDEE